ncbi:hypothetical protein J437_LFUL014733 [Ladona fulva]|uniref:ZAD domain-containing protein n=1 Tax=Ladona fulva TaxID=123851 RepID=A0A8K0KHD6_LADFU|nr:hypothetical protein J437_LFUL014733 [Ladona fulva]
MELNSNNCFGSYIMKMNDANIDVMCRLCLNNSFLHYNIFTDETMENKPTYEIINYAYDLEISANDGLPQYICENCHAIVKTFKVYKSNAHRARSEIIRLKQKKDKVENASREVVNSLEKPDETEEVDNKVEESQYEDCWRDAASSEGNSKRRDVNQLMASVKQEEDSFDGGTTSPDWQTYNNPPEYMENTSAAEMAESGNTFSSGKDDAQFQKPPHEPVCSIHEEDSRTDLRYMQHTTMVNNSVEYVSRNFSFPPAAGMPFEVTSGRKRWKRSSVYNEIRFKDRGSHWPEFVEKRGRCVCCALSQIQSRPHSRCGLCKVYLCINEKKNCFYRYHYT